MAKTFADYLKIAFDKPHRLGPYWAVWHDRAKDKQYFTTLQPSVMKIMDGGSSHYSWAYQALPGTLIIARDWGLDDRHGTQWAACLADPVGTAKRHIKEWKVLIERNGIDKNRSLFMGINEPNVWVPRGIEATVDYTVALCDEGAENDMHMLALNLSVGWPGNSDTATVKDTPPNWAPYAKVLPAIQRGNHILGLHEYWNFGGPEKGWGWLAGRFMKCPWDVPIVIGEFAFSRAVNNSQSVPTKEQGWQANGIKPEAFADMVIEYINRISKDERVLGSCGYLSDFQNEEWWSKDFEPAYPAIMSRLKFLQKPAPYKPGAPVTPPVVVPPVVEPPVTPPVAPPVTPPSAVFTLSGKVVKTLPNDGTSYVSGTAPNGSMVHFAWRGNPSLAAVQAGPHAGYESWPVGYYSIPLYVKGSTPCIGDWDIWCVMSDKTSERVQFHTDGNGGKSNQIEVNFLMTSGTPSTPPPIVVPPIITPPVTPPVIEPVSGLWQWPLKNVAFTQYWGAPQPKGFKRRYRSTDLDTYIAHEGLDFRALPGTDVMSVADGVVLYVGADNSYGNYICVRHGPKGQQWDTFFAHLQSKPTLKAGASVTKGQVIAKSGNTGTGGVNAHLHMELWSVDTDGKEIEVPGSLHEGCIDPVAFFEGLERGAALGGGSSISLPFVAK